MDKHREYNENLRICAEHIDYQLRNELTTVTNLLDSLETSNPGVIAAISHIKLDDGVNGTKSSFDRTVDFLLPTDIVNRQG